MLELWYERWMDNFLNIETEDVREWSDRAQMRIYNRTEATPYQVLDQLFDVYEWPDQPNLVDFGCGTGRLAFYVHQSFNIPVTGLEFNQDVFPDLLENLRRYRSVFAVSDGELNFIQEAAENYPIQPDNNVFYFFNPFVASVFKQVLSNIEKSLAECPRPADIILYYPLYEWQQVMARSRFFQRIGSIPLKSIFDDEYEKFIIYHYMGKG